MAQLTRLTQLASRINRLHKVARVASAGTKRAKESKAHAGPTERGDAHNDHDIIHDHDADEETLTRINQKLTHITNLYDTGKPLFPRSLLQNLDDQITAGKEEVTIEDLDGVNHTYSLIVPAWCADFATSYRISYSSLQTLTCIHPSFPEASLRETSPISICYTSSPEPLPQASYEEVEATYARNQKKWEESETCSTLIRNLQGLVMDEAKLGRVRKIVAFGLGSLAAMESREEEGGYHRIRAHAQHAAIRTMVETLVSSWNQTHYQDHSDLDIDTDTETKECEEEHSIKCYAQDPAYTETDMTLLHKLGITPLDDPKGFLEIDDSTLVFSVSPNVPVKQVVADVQWPAAMIWNTISLEEREGRWEKKVRNGEEYWVVPFTTDPDSARVRSMAQEYTSVALRDSNEFFGDLTIYAR
ncbi:hypothetical protein BJX70DRAFT_391855 [Aspergillus crustosus]